MKHAKPTPLYFLFLLFMALSPFKTIALPINDEYSDPIEYIDVANDSYIYLNSELYNIIEFVFTISTFDRNTDSPINALKQYISDGYVVALQNEVLYVLDYAAHLLFEEPHLSIDDHNKRQLIMSLDNLVQAITEGTLSVDENTFNQKRNLPLWTINKRIKVEGKAKFANDAIFYGKTRTHSPARFYSRVHFKKNIIVDGAATIQDAVINNLQVNNCIPELCVDNLSAADATIGNLTLSGGIAIENLTLNTLTATDAIIDNLQVNNCMPNLCVQDLSTVEVTITGPITNPTDAATKAYVDSVVASPGTNLNLPNTTVKRDGTGSFAAQVISLVDEVASGSITVTPFNTAGVVHNNASGLLSSSLIVDADITDTTISNTKLATISSSNIANDIVVRDGSGNFSAGTITASLNGNATSATTATTATTATNFTGALAGDVTGTQGATVVSFVGGVTAANVASGANAANAATNANTINTIVKRDGSGNFSAGTITASLNGNATSATTATTATTATNFTGALAGDVTGTQSATVVSLVGGVTAANVASGANAANAATNANTINTIVKRDGSGNFSAGTITASLNGNATSATTATTATTATNFSGTLAGDVTGTQSATVVSLVGGVTAANVASGANAANAATNANTINTIVKRDGSGNFSAGTITASLNGNATTATNFTGTLAGDVTGTQSATVVSLVGGVTAANVASGANAANAATSANTVSTIVKRDASGDFSAGTISLVDEVASGNITITPFNTAGVVHNNASGLLSSSLIVNADITDATISNAKLATISSSNVAGDIVVRDGSGNFAAQNITMVDGIASGFLSIPTTTSLTVGTIQQNGASFIHSFGTNNTFVGKSAGNFTTSGTGNNVGIGTNSLTGNTTGSNNVAVGTSTLTTNSTGANNIAIGFTALTANTVGTNNVAVGSQALTTNNVGSNNVALGVNSLTGNITGSDNIGIGFNALAANTTANQNIAIGSSALATNTTGTSNIAIGYHALNLNVTGNFNTALGVNALSNNTSSNNTAVGLNSLSLNTTGVNNVGVGFSALQSNTTGINNTAVGALSLVANATGQGNTSIGYQALTANTSGDTNTAVGANALLANTTGQGNIALGASSLQANTTGISNVAIGTGALLVNTTGVQNTALGNSAGIAVNGGSNNVLLGYNIGAFLTTGNNNIYVDGSGASIATINESNTIRIGFSQTSCFIQGIRGVTTGVANAIPVLIDSNGQLGTTSSSIRFKRNINDMADASSNVLGLRPVTFIYKEDTSETTQYGLIAEEVEQVFPQLVIHDVNGLPLTVKYDALPVLLLNEMQKQQEKNVHYDCVIQTLLDRVAALEEQVQA